MSQFDAEGTLYIPYDEWYEFIKKLFPHLAGHGQLVLGPPRMENDELEVPFALGTDDVHPRDWAIPPEWLKGLPR